MIEKYFGEFFHKDRSLLKELGVPDDYVVPPIKNKVWKYTDTDSGYLIFEECIDAINWQGSVKEFVLTLNRVRLAEYIKKVLNEYGKLFAIAYSPEQEVFGWWRVHFSNNAKVKSPEPPVTLI
jgi:hypothetical protein